MAARAVVSRLGSELCREWCGRDPHACWIEAERVLGCGYCCEEYCARPWSWHCPAAMACRNDACRWLKALLSEITLRGQAFKLSEALLRES